MNILISLDSSVQGFNKIISFFHNGINLTSSIGNVNEINTYEFLRGTGSNNAIILPDFFPEFN